MAYKALKDIIDVTRESVNIIDEMRPMSLERMRESRASQRS